MATARRTLAWIGCRAPADVGGVGAAVGGAGGVAAGLLAGGTDRLAVVSAAAGLGAALGGGAGIGLWAACRTVRPLAPHAGHSSTAPRIFSDRVPAVPRVFVGRDGLVAQLVAGMPAPADRVRVRALQGLAGVGKTSLAAAVAEAVRDQVDVVWWLRCETPAVLVADLAALAPHVGLPELDDVVATARSVRAWLEQTDCTWTVLLDGLPNLASCDEWLPKRGGGDVLITSRSTDVHRVADVVSVEPFEPDVAALFLRTRVASANPRAAQGDLASVVERLGGLPLALEQVAAWVARAPIRTFDAFTRLYDDASWGAVNDSTRPVGYEHTVSTTWQVSVAAATTEAPQAGRLLAGLSFVAPNDLPCAWLRAQVGHAYLEGADEAAIDGALAALHGYALVKLHATESDELGDTVAVHPVIQDAARREASPEAAGFAIDVLADQAHGGDRRDHRNWPLLEALLPHGLAVAATARIAVPDRAEQLCRTLNWIGLYQDARGAPRDAFTTITTALELAGTHLGPDHLLTLTSRINLAYAHHMTGDVEGAVTLLEPTLSDCERVLGSEHPETLRSRNNLAGAYEWLGDVDRAIPLHAATLADRERVLGRDHTETLQSRHNLATAHRIAGDVDRAIELYDVTLVDMERVLGREHPSTLLTRTDRAVAYMTAGAADRAVVLLEEVAGDFEQIQGAHHPGTLRCRGFLAAAYEAAGDLSRAIAVYEPTLADMEQVLGNEHPYTQRTRAGLARAIEASQS